MAEYIEREAALAFQNELEPVICKSVHSGGIYSATRDDDLVRFLSAIPAADVVPVRHGKWEKSYADHEAFGVRPFFRYCSECNEVTVHQYNYCPNCGADMREPPKEETE